MEQLYVKDGPAALAARSSMTAIKVVAWIVILLMGANLGNVALNSGFDHGVGFDTFLAGADDPWQSFINNDLLAGLLLLLSWMIFREGGGRVIGTIAWVWMLLWWGNVVAAVYVLSAVRQSGGDWHRFFLGRRAGVLKNVTLPPMLRMCCGLAAIAVAIWLPLAIERTGFAFIPTYGYAAAFLPVILSLLLLALPSRQAAS